MAGLKRLLVAAVGALTLVGVAAVGAAAHERGRLIEFDSMTPVTGSAVGTVNDRGLHGGGLPWTIASGGGEVDRHGSVEVRVTGLVLAAGSNSGKNPLTPFNAVVSCITPHGIVNVATAGAPATTAGDATIDASVTLPRPCKSPEVFVGFTNPSTGVFIWFAESSKDRD